MAERLKENLLVPELLITSPAVRTVTTAEIFAEYLLLPEPQADPLIYAASPQTLLNVINRLPPANNFIGIVGHNPGITLILDYLAGVAREVHTCTVALIEFETDEWSAITQGSGSLTYYSSPME
jgi:phosphohistidine phosphatase